MSRKIKVWTVVYSSDIDTDAVVRFRHEKDARSFCAGRRHYQEPAEHFCDLVPVHIAERWGVA